MGKIKQFFHDFKTFISKGSILDLAVGVVVGSAFTKIVNSLVNDLLMPLITTAVPGGLEGLVTVLNPAEAAVSATTVNKITYWDVVYDKDVVNVINWGSFINAIINFIIIAFIMFVIVRAAMKFNKFQDYEAKVNAAITPSEYASLRKEGHSIRDIRKMAQDRVEAADKAAAEKAAADAAAKAKEETEVQLLHDIKDLLASQQKPAKKEKEEK
jgi:large conductance mechanosensitive channel